MNDMSKISVSKTHPKVLAATQLVDRLREYAPRISEAGKIPGEVMNWLYDAELFELLRPSRFGGQPVGGDVAFEVARELARGDGSVGWVHTVFTSHELIIGLFPEDVQQEYWTSSDRPLSASSYVPSGKAAAVDGGYRLTGQWSFCSGIDHANWIVVGAIVGMIGGATPKPDMRYFLVPADDYTIVNDWDVMGMQGTGSKSIVLDDVFVADNRILLDDEVAGARTPGALTNPDKSARYNVWSLIGFSLTGIATGVARNAYEAVLEQCVARAGGAKFDPLFEARRPAIALQLAKISALIDTSDLIYTRALKETFAAVEAGEELSMEQRVRNRRDQCYSVTLAREAGDLIMSVGGARNIREGSLIQRAYRDLTTLSVHPGTNWDGTALSYGAFVLGGPPTERYV